MFDKKSDYALNKREKNAIVYSSTTISIRLTRADFASEDEFLKWKSWSDGDYQTGEQEGRSFYDNTIPLDERLDMIGAVASIEVELFGRMDEAERTCMIAYLLEQIKSCLTEKQYHRLWMYYVDSMTMDEIALKEGVSRQGVSLSISSARCSLKKYLQNY